MSQCDPITLILMAAFLVWYAIWTERDIQKWKPYDFKKENKLYEKRLENQQYSKK